MIPRLLLLFIVLPLVELGLLLKLADWTDWRFTFLLVVITGLVGSMLARSQGYRTFQQIQGELSAGKMPTHSLLDAAMIFLAGALLVTPGILTDFLGMSLLIPACRRFYGQRMAAWIKSHFTIQTFSGQDSSTGRSEVIDSFVVDKRKAGGQQEADEDGPTV